jgi:hypothetical protein
MLYSNKMKSTRRTENGQCRIADFGYNRSISMLTYARDKTII